MQKVTKSDLVETFKQKWTRLGQNCWEAAKAYKACVDAGIDMARYVGSKSLHEKLMIVAKGSVVELSASELLFLPQPHVALLSTLSKADQKRVVHEGVEIRRPHGVSKQTFLTMSVTEVRRVVDTTAGVGRVLSLGEQDQRAIPQPRVHDQVFEIRLNFAQAKDLLAMAHKRGCSPQVLIRDALKRDGII